jgi:uncharacterized YccA/Bax inhibitor family protein
MANPALNEKFLSKISALEDGTTMSIHGTINKAGFLLLIAIAGAALGWGSYSPVLLIVAFISSFALSLLIIFGPQRANYLSQGYAFAEGVLLGSISSMYALRYPGIVSNALLLTLSCLLVMLGLYRFKIIRVTDRLRSVLTAATMAIVITYAISMIMGMFGTDLPMIHQSSPMGIGFSLLVVGVAAFNLLLNFDMIEQAQAKGAPKFMEWYCAFSLLVTLVWVYLEILRLLSKLNKK